MVHRRWWEWELSWRKILFNKLSTCLELWIVIKNQKDKINKKKRQVERMEAPSELLCFWRHFCKLNPTFVILECWSVFITSCFGKGHILNLPCFRCFFPWPEGPGRSTAGAECSCVYNVCIMGPLVAKTVWFEVCLRHCSCGCGLKKPRQKILRVLLGIESYLNVMLWILRGLKSCVCHS